MVRMQMVVAVVVLAVCCSNAEARGRRMGRQPVYNQYYNTATPTYSAIAPANAVAPQSSVVQPTAASQSNAVVQASGTSTDGGIVQANATATPATAADPATSKPSVPAAARVGSAQWKAEQSARLCSVQHLGGGFGGGSFEGNGFGATAQQAIQNSCYWGQRTPIEIGVARGANGYYATVFYR